MRVLIVEDEAIVALMTELIVEGLGHQVVGPAADIATALLLLAPHDVDAAILDVNIAGERVYPVADALIEAKVPFAFTTGYGTDALEERYRSFPIVAKPYDDTMMESILVGMSGPKAT